MKRKLRRRTVRHSRRLGVLVALAAGLFAGLVEPQNKRPAELIITGGDIVTANDAQRSAEAVAIEDGKIVALGSLDEVSELRGEDTRVMDLGGKTLAPGFIDAHGHVYNAGVQALVADLLAAPDGDVENLASLQRKLRDWGTGETAARLGWIIGFGYDDAQLEERRHPTRDDLDAVATEIPVLAVHQSGHLAAVNSRALELAGIDAASEDPPGGVIRRRADTREPDGVLEESAFWMVLGALPRLSAADKEAIALAGQALYLRYGFTTAQEGRSTPEIDSVWAALAEKGELKLDVVSYPDVQLADRAMQSPYVGRHYRNGFRIGGVKLNLDGSPQGKTAWLSEPYYEAPPGQDDTYVGYPAFEEEEVTAFVDKAFTSDWQILSHVNGDAAIDQLIRAVRAANEKYGKADRRPVAIHAQTAREDQIAAFEELGIFPAFFPMHTFYWGDWHRVSVLGPERGANISPTGWAMKRGMIFSTHHDAPVAFPDSMRVLSATVTRVARGSGDVVGSEHRVSPLVGLKAMTLWAAYQHFEERTKGSIEVGKVADFVVLSDNPIEVDPLTIAGIEVVETIKNGKSVYRRNGTSPETAVTVSPRELMRYCASQSGRRAVELRYSTRENPTGERSLQRR